MISVITSILLCKFFKFYFIFKLDIIVLVLPNIKMNPPQVYMCSPSWALLPPPSPFHPSGSSLLGASALAHFLRGSFIFLELSCRSCLYIFEINSLSVASFAIIFSHSEGSLFTLLIVSFVVCLSFKRHLFPLHWVFLYNIDGEHMHLQNSFVHKSSPVEI